MKKLNDNIIAKLVASVFTIIVMGIIIFFVFDYYNDIAKKGNDNTNNQKENSDNKNDTEKDKSNTNIFDNVSFDRYDLNRKSIVLNDKVLILSIVETDAGKLIQVDDTIVTDIYLNDTVYYAVLPNSLLIEVENSDEAKAYLILKDKQVIDLSDLVKNKIENKAFRYFISDSSFTSNKKIELKDNSIYITYRLDNYFFNENDNEIFEYYFKLQYLEDGNIGEIEIENSYTIKDYKEK